MCSLNLLRTSRRAVLEPEVKCYCKSVDMSPPPAGGEGAVPGDQAPNQTEDKELLEQRLAIGQQKIKGLTQTLCEHGTLAADTGPWGHIKAHVKPALALSASPSPPSFLSSVCPACCPLVSGNLTYPWGPVTTYR